VADLTALVDTSVLVGGLPAPVPLDQGWVVSSITVGELEAGVLLASEPHVRAARLRRLASTIAEAPVVDVDRAVAARYGELRPPPDAARPMTCGSPRWPWRTIFCW